jgi:hypothetical protein
MKNVLVLLLVALTARAQTPPTAEIANGAVKATLYLPDAQTGYYRGARFDWAGVIAGLEHQGHSYFGVWFDRYEPTLHDAITGPVEEFAPLNYDGAKPGETFVKPGVGVLRRADDKPYHFATPFETVQRGNWTVVQKKDHVTFTQQLTDPASGYAYVYEKTVRLTPGQPQLVLEHRLKNTGRKRIETTVYDHNFLVMDRQPTGPDFVVKFPFALQPVGPVHPLLQLSGQELTFQKPVEKGNNAYQTLQGYTDHAADYDLRVENRKTRAGVRIRGDRPIAKLAFWCNPANLSPEPFLALNVEPNQETTWTITYDFYEVP